VAGVMPPLISRHGRPWSDREHRRLSVVPWVSETRALEGAMSPAHWRSYGVLLAKVHATAVTDALAISLPREDHTHDRGASAARTLDSSLRLTAEDPAAGGTVDDLVRALAQEWCVAGDRVSTLLDQADRLGRDLHTQKSTSVVCHGDPHLGNVLIGQDERVWLIDWDETVLAPRERDLMFILGGVLAFAPVTRQQQSLVLRGLRVYRHRPHLPGVLPMCACPGRPSLPSSTDRRCAPIHGPRAFGCAIHSPRSALPNWLGQPRPLVRGRGCDRPPMKLRPQA
jgi:spectinomycin phosphotransferase